MRQKIVAGNWKMHGSWSFTQDTIQKLRAQVTLVPQVEMLVCPPYPYLAQAVSSAGDSGMLVGAQNLSSVASPGAYTGEVAGFMLADVGCRHVIVGHSERRALYAESNEVVAEKVKVALDAGLVPVVCVGETLQERESGIMAQVIAAQLDAVTAVVGADGWAQCVIAYEPVWAIGTGRTATPEQAQEVHAFIRERLAATSADVAAGISILYGGSVKADNAAAIFTQPDVDGGLVGGASLQPDEFAKIYAAAAAL